MTCVEGILIKLYEGLNYTSLYVFTKIICSTDICCCRKKATALVKELARGQQQCLSERMGTSAFTLSTDGSNDDNSKQSPIVIRAVNVVDTGVVSSELLSIPICEESATGENIFKLLEAELASRDVPWTNCLAVGCDNALVMTRGNKGVIVFVRKNL